MSSNLPPGVTTSMLPGNTPEDAAWEKFIDWAWDEMADGSFSIEEAYMVVKSGMASIRAIREDMNKVLSEVRVEERMSYDMERNQEDEERERKAAFNSECG